MKEIRFTKRDIVIVLILGELVGLFAYAILRKLAEAEEATAMIKGLSAHSLTFPLFSVGIPLAALSALVITFLLGKRFNPAFFQFGKFATTGFSNTAIDWGALNLLLLLSAGTSELQEATYKALSFIVATLNSFLWNRFWAFEKKGTANIGKQAVGFYLVTIVGFLINVGVFALVNSIGSGSALWTGIVAPAAGTASTMFWNFFGYKLIVFKDKHSAPAQDAS